MKVSTILKAGVVLFGLWLVIFGSLQIWVAVKDNTLNTIFDVIFYTLGGGLIMYYAGKDLMKN